MYCKKCGKYIEGNAEICPECQNAEQPENQVVVENIYTSEPVKNKKEGIGGAITGFVLGLVAFIFANIDLTVFVTALTNRYRYISNARAFYFYIAIMLLFGVIACTILGLIFGIKAIKSFKEQKKASQKPKVVGLVFGIIDVVTAVMNFIYIFVLLILLLALFIA